jgi:hypothetical protein
VFLALGEQQTSGLDRGLATLSEGLARIRLHPDPDGLVSGQFRGKLQPFSPEQLSLLSERLGWPKYDTALQADLLVPASGMVVVVPKDDTLSDQLGRGELVR